MLWVLECDLSKTKRKFVTLVVPRILGKKKTQALNHTVDGSKILLGGFYLINYKDVKKSQLVQVFFHQYLNQPAMTYLPTNLKNNNGAIFAKVDY